MLPHVAGDVDIFALRDAAERLDDELRLDEVAALLVAQALLAAPLLDALPPFGERLFVGTACGFAPGGNQVSEHLLGIAHDGHVNAHALGNGGRVHVNVDDFALAPQEVRDVADAAVAEARAHVQQHVAFKHGAVGFKRAVHPLQPEELPVTGGKHAQPHERAGHRKTGERRQLAQLLARARADDAAAHVDVGALGRQQQLERLADLPAVPLAHRVVGAHAHGFRIARPRGAVEGHILGQVHHHRPGTPGAGDVERLFHRHRQVAHVLDEEVVLDRVARNAHGVALLKGVRADVGARHLPGEHHQRHRIHVRRGQPGDGIGRPRAGGDQRHAHFARGACIAVSGMHGGLLVAHQNMLQLFLFIERVINMQHHAARITPNVFHAFGLQRAHKNLGAPQFGRSGLLCGSRWRRFRL